MLIYKAVVFLIDSSDKGGHFVSKEELEHLFEHKDLERAVFLVLANKQDLKDAMTTEQIVHLFNLHTISKNTWNIHGISALTGTGIEPAFDWLTEQIAKNK